MKRVRFSGNNKHARWAKGGASSSNPRTMKFRQSVMERHLESQANEDQLAEMAIDKLSAFTIGDDKDSTIGGSEIDAKTIDTTFSAFSVASCASFRGLHKHWGRVRDDPIAKEICSLASMLTELANQDSDSKEGDSNSTNEANADDPILKVKQFGALILFVTNNETQETTLTAAYYLLSLIIGKINPQILRNQFLEIFPAIRSHLTQYFKSSNQMLLKSALSCYAEFICRQPMKVLFESQVDAELIAAYIHHEHPKVRKTCSRLIGLLFNNSDVVSQGVCKSCEHPFVRFITRNLHGSLLDDSKPSRSKMRMLNLLEVVISHSSPELFKASLETCLSICSGTDLTLRKKALQLIQNVFLNEPEQDLVGEKLNAQLLSALEELKPSFFDEEMMLNWLSTFEAVLKNLSKLNAQLHSSHLVCFLSFCVSTVFASQLKSLVQYCGQICIRIFSNLDESTVQFWRESKHDKLSDISKISEIVSELTSFKYSDNFAVVFKVISKIYTALGQEFYETFESSVVNLFALRTGDSQIPGLPVVLKNAVAAYGPEKVLDSYPLNIRGQPDEDFARSWMIPLLQRSVVNSSLSFWQTKLYPIAKNAESHFESLFNKPFQLKPLQVLHSQIWGLLPVFCKDCTDAQQSFTPGFAKHLSALIAQNYRCSDSICEAILSLLSSSKQEVVEAVVKFSKNYLPQFFNLYLEEKTKPYLRENSLKVCSAFMAKISKEQLESYFEKVCKQIQLEETDARTLKLLIDLLREMTPFLDTDQINKVFSELVPGLLKREDCMKKVMLMLKKLIGSNNDDSKMIEIKPILSKFIPVILKGLDEGSVALRRQVMKCLLLFFDHSSGFDLVHLNDIVPRIVRTLAFGRDQVKKLAVKVFKSSCNLFVEKSSFPKPVAVEKLATTLMENLEVSCNDDTLGALTALQYLVALYSECLNEMLYQKFFLLVSDVLKVANRPLHFDPALHLLKVIISVMPAENLYQYCEKIVTELCDWNRKKKLMYRFHVKVVLFRLAKKLGPDIVHSNCPEDHKKLVSSIRKQINREERVRKAATSEVADEDDIDVETATNKSRVTKAETIVDILRELESSDDESKTNKTKRSAAKSTRSSVFLSEAGDSIADFTEKNAAKYLTTKALTKKEAKKDSKSSEVKFAPDGRLLLIGEDGRFMGVDERKVTVDDVEIGEEDLKDRQIGIKSDTSDSEDDNEEISAKKKRKKARSEASSAPSWKTLVSRRRKPFKSSVPMETGKMYKARKAGGDINVRGKPAPFAFMPLDARVLNKRKAKKVEGRLKGLVKSSKKGAGKGSRIRNKLMAKR